MYINHNKMASNVANNLTSHYSNLATSTQRLSSGLRVNSAADDAAGLAIRELMRSDIAALNQGVRNANDGISLIQTADGALGIIDEKLIRMKELAEQAATGTYDSTQRLMIDSEYQQMASEITRIANATDFNGTKLLNGNLAGEHDGSGLTSTGKMKIHFGPENDSAEDYYYIEIGEATAEAFGLGNNSKWEDVQARGVKDFEAALVKGIKENTDLTAAEKGKLYDQVDAAVKELGNVLTKATNYEEAYKYIDKDQTGASPLMTQYLEAASKRPAATVVSDADITKQYLADKGYATSAAEAKKDLTAWNNAQTAANAKTANDADTYQAYLVANKLTIDTVDVADTDWTGAATTAATTKLQDAASPDDKVYAEYVKARLETGYKNLTEAVATVNGGTGSADWEAAKTNAGAGASDEKIWSFYLTQRKVQGLLEGDELTAAGGDMYAAAKRDTVSVTGSGGAVAAGTAWNSHKTTLAGTPTPTKQQIFDEYIALKGKTMEQAQNDTAGWTAAKTAASADPATYASAHVATEDEVFNQYIATKLGAPASDSWNNSVSIKDNAAGYTKADGTAVAGLDATAWADAKAKVEKAAADADAAAAATADPEAINKFWNGLRESDQQRLKYEFGKNAADRIAKGAANDELKPDTTNIVFGNQEILNNAIGAMNTQVQSRDFAGYSIETQENAQEALVAVNNAIVEKDKTRAHLGALQNRLENTVSNLTVQSENLQAAESRISDVDVATEMTQFVRNQILTQSAVAMLSQANSMPQMAMQLIG